MKFISLVFVGNFFFTFCTSADLLHTDKSHEYLLQNEDDDSNDLHIDRINSDEIIAVNDLENIIDDALHNIEVDNNTHKISEEIMLADENVIDKNSKNYSIDPDSKTLNLETTTTSKNWGVDEISTLSSSTTDSIYSSSDDMVNRTKYDTAAILQNITVDLPSVTNDTKQHIIVITNETENNAQIEQEDALIKVNKLSDQIRVILHQFKESGSVTIPDVAILDPMPIPDMKKQVSMANMYFYNMSVYGLSNFSVEHIDIDLDKMQVYVKLLTKKVMILGNYTMTTFFYSSAGGFNVSMLNVITEGAAALDYNTNGELEASETDMDMSFLDIILDFQNLGFLGSLFQKIIELVGTIIFDGIKPAMLTEMNSNMKNDINTKLKTSGIKTNSSMNPVDQAIYEGRSYVKDLGYDPYYIEKYTRRVGIFDANISEFRLTGLSRFYRVGELVLSLDNGTIEAGIELATKNLIGKFQWSVGFGTTPFTEGKINFTIDHLQIRAVTKISLDLSKKIELYDLDFLLGETQLSTGKENVNDYMLEMLVNNLPSLLRHLIVDSIEDPVKQHIQEILYEVNVEDIVNEQLPNIDKLNT